MKSRLLFVSTLASAGLLSACSGVSVQPVQAYGLDTYAVYAVFKLLSPQSPFVVKEGKLSAFIFHDHICDPYAQHPDVSGPVPGTGEYFQGFFGYFQMIKPALTQFRRIPHDFCFIRK